MTDDYKPEPSRCHLGWAVDRLIHILRNNFNTVRYSLVINLRRHESQIIPVTRTFNRGKMSAYTVNQTVRKVLMPIAGLVLCLVLELRVTIPLEKVMYLDNLLLHKIACFCFNHTSAYC